MAEEQAVEKGRGKLTIVRNCAGPDGPTASLESSSKMCRRQGRHLHRQLNSWCLLDSGGGPTKTEPAWSACRAAFSCSLHKPPTDLSRFPNGDQLKSNKEKEISWAVHDSEWCDPRRHRISRGAGPEVYGLCRCFVNLKHTSRWRRRICDKVGMKMNPLR